MRFEGTLEHKSNIENESGRPHHIEGLARFKSKVALLKAILIDIEDLKSCEKAHFGKTIIK